jgi:hypothetical protein
MVQRHRRGSHWRRWTGGHDHRWRRAWCRDHRRRRAGGHDHRRRRAGSHDHRRRWAGRSLRRRWAGSNHYWGWRARCNDHWGWRGWTGCGCRCAWAHVGAWEEASVSGPHNAAGAVSTCNGSTDFGNPAACTTTSTAPSAIRRSGAASRASLPACVCAGATKTTGTRAKQSHAATTTSLGDAQRSSTRATVTRGAVVGKRRITAAPSTPACTSPHQHRASM